LEKSLYALVTIINSSEERKGGKKTGEKPQKRQNRQNIIYPKAAASIAALYPRPQQNSSSPFKS